MNFKLIFIIILIASHTISIDAQENDNQIKLTINSDRIKYNPGDVALFVLTGNQERIGTFEISYNSKIIKSVEFGNLTKEPFQIIWNIETHATNGTYQAIAFYNEIGKVSNDTLKFGIERTDIKEVLFKWRYLILNITFVYEGKKLKNWSANITNLFTRESQEIEGIEERLILNLDNDFDDLIRFQPGQAIEIKLEKKGFKGSKIIPAQIGDNQIKIKADKLFDENIILVLAFTTVFFILITYIIYHNRDILQRSKYHRKDEIDVHQIPELNYRDKKYYDY